MSSFWTPAFDIRMPRPDACSVSLTHICHRREASTMHYASREGEAAFDPFSTVTLSLSRKTREQKNETNP